MKIVAKNEHEMLSNLGIDQLNEIQLKTLTALETSKELILLAATGSGKTLAFLIPLLRSIKHDENLTQALIMVPSRELALQIESVLKQMQTGFKITACYGGHKREIEENNLQQPPAVIIATAGRLADHLRRKTVDPTAIQFLVLDEFDKILELGFIEEMKFILDSLPAVRTRMLTSATHALEIPAFVQMDAATHLNFLTGTEPAADMLTVRAVRSPDNDKLETLFSLLCFVNDTSTIVFCNHRESVERVSNFLSSRSLINVFYHGGMEQQDREVALTKFKNSSANVLVTTDLASRGLDIANIRSIIHYHLPATEESFTHRNGRTARMNTSGTVYLMYGPEETLPDYVKNDFDFLLPENSSLPEKPKWSTLFIAAGKKDKINKIDIVGFLSNKAHLKKDEIGLIEVKDFSAFVAVRKSKIGNVVELVKNEKIKNRKVKIAIAK